MSAPVTRREMLARCANGFGAVAMSALLAQESSAARRDLNPFAARQPHFPGKAKQVIFLYMDGGPSQIDTFDFKPRLIKDNGKPFAAKMEPTQFNDNGNTLAPLWKFNKYGESGIEVSDLFPHTAQHVDKMAIIKSMTSKFSEHTFANYFLHTGHGLQGRPSAGAWATYGLGSECEDLPGFIVLNGGLTPPGGLDNFNSGYLPATYQASVFNSSAVPVANIRPSEANLALQRNKLQLMRQLDQQGLNRQGKLDQLESAIANYEMAARMQLAVPELMDLSGESKETLEAYGLNHRYTNTNTYGRLCLVARRLVERGVRFIELTCTPDNGDRWDQHGHLKEGHMKNALAVDQPIGALLGDLEQRGLLDETLVVYAGEFGRTPFAQGTDGRDHNPFGFTIWMAGGGIRGGTTYGETDEFGYKVVRDKLEIHDMHAIMLHALGLDHEKLTYRFSGRDMRLTDVHGRVPSELFA